jgi:hypothetical protein
MLSQKPEKEIYASDDDSEFGDTDECVVASQAEK